MKASITCATILLGIATVANVPAWGQDRLELRPPPDTLNIGIIADLPEGEEAVTIPCPVCIPGASLYLTEPGSPNEISDVLFVSTLEDATPGYVEDDGLTLTFLSDPLTIIGASTSIEETGDLQDVSQYLLTVSARDAGWTLWAQSDVDSVPEPASLLLLGAGLVGVAARTAWRKRRAL